MLQTLSNRVAPGTVQKMGNCLACTRPWVAGTGDGIELGGDLCVEGGVPRLAPAGEPRGADR